MNEKKILFEIKKAMGISIYKGYSIEGNDYWTVSGGFVNASGYKTLEEALEIWASTQKRERLKINE